MRRHASPLLAITAALLTALSTSGCTTTTGAVPTSTPLTARQLEPGDVVTGLSFSWPLGILPDARGIVQYGIGGVADVGAHASMGLILSTLGPVLIPQLGASLRVYPTDWLTLRLDGNTVYRLLFTADNKLVYITSTFQATSTTTDARRWYGGFHAHSVWVDQRNQITNAEEVRWGGLNLGGLVGYEVARPNDRTFRVELIVSPLAVTPDTLQVDIEELDPPFAVQLSISSSWWMNRELSPRAPASPKPSDQTSPAPAKPAPAKPTPAKPTP